MARPDPSEDAASGEEPAEGKKTPFLTGPQWALFGGMLLVVITLSVALTATLLSPAVERDERVRGHLSDQVAALEERMAFYERELNTLTSKVDELEAEQQAAAQASIPPVLAERLINQEESLQRFISALKEGMQELSHMVPGSREWLELYRERLDAVIEESEDRAQDMQEWETNTASES